MGPKVWFFTSATASSNFMAKATKTIRGAQTVQPLQNSIPEALAEDDICIIMAPAVRQDYLVARSLAATNPIVVVNGLAKVGANFFGNDIMRWIENGSYALYRDSSFFLLRS